jgi:hypothetical protein
VRKSGTIVLQSSRRETLLVVPTNKSVPPVPTTPEYTHRHLVKPYGLFLTCKKLILLWNSSIFGSFATRVNEKGTNLSCAH